MILIIHCKQASRRARYANSNNQDESSASTTAIVDATQDAPNARICTECGREHTNAYHDICIMCRVRRYLYIPFIQIQ